MRIDRGDHRNRDVCQEYRQFLELTAGEFADVYLTLLAELPEDTAWHVEVFIRAHPDTFTSPLLRLALLDLVAATYQRGLSMARLRSPLVAS